MTNASPLRIDIVSDVMCPWCIIGYLQLARALEQTGTAAEIHWHPFELNPDMPPEGQNLREHVAEKYGATAAQSEASRRQMAALGADLGFAFRFGEDSRIWNSFAAHQLLHWAGTQGRQHDLKMAMFRAHFTQGRNMADAQVLADVAGEIGLDRDEARAVLRDGRFAEEVRAHEAFWLKQGIRGVPAMVFDRQYLVTGAQGVENYADILGQIAARGA